MGGVYGEFLGYFSELQEDFRVFKQNPKVTSGYDLTFARKVRGIRQSVNRGFDTKTRNSVPVLNITNTYYFWSEDKLDIATEFLEIDGEMYRPMKQPMFNREGGFWENVVEQVVGNDGTEREESDLEEGTF